MSSRVMSIALVALAVLVRACSESHTVDFDAGPVSDTGSGGMRSCRAAP